MLSYLLQEWSKTREPWFSKRHLEEISIADFKTLLKKKILFYELPSGEDSTDDEYCVHGCSLFVEKNDAGLAAVCMEHPEEGTTRLAEDQLTRYRLSIEAVIRYMREANGLEGQSAPCGRGRFVGYKTHGDQLVAVVLMPSVTKDDLLEIAGMANTLLKDYPYIFVLAPELYVKWLWAIPTLGDRIVLLNMFEVFDQESFELSFDWGLFKLRQRGVLKDIHLEITGRMDRRRYEIRINGHPEYLTDAEFLLLFRLVQGYKTAKERWVASKQLCDEGIATSEGLHAAIGRLKKALRWQDLIENDRKRYRIAPIVTEVTVNRKKLLENENARVKAIARKLPVVGK